MCGWSGAVGLIGAYLGGDDKREQVQWFGAALFMLMGLAFTLPWVGEFMHNVNWGGVEYSEAFQQAIINLAAYVTKRMGGGFLLSGTVISVIALWLLIWGWNMTSSQQRTGKIVHIPA